MCGFLVVDVCPGFCDVRKLGVVDGFELFVSSRVFRPLDAAFVLRQSEGECFVNGVVHLCFPCGVIAAYEDGGSYDCCQAVCS